MHLVEILQAAFDKGLGAWKSVAFGWDSTNSTPVKIAVDPSGNISTTELPSSSSVTVPPNVTSSTYENAHLIKSQACNLFSLNGYNSGPDQFILLIDSASAAAEGAVPVLPIFVPAQSSFSYSAGKYGRPFANGLYICNSSTGPTKTIGATDCWFDVQVK